MKNTIKITLLLVVGLFANLCIQAQGLTSGLISVWELNETSGSAVDTKSSNNGTLNGQIVQNQSGILSTAYQFPGSNSWVSISNSSSQFSFGDEMTVSIWINVSNSSVSSDAAICLDATSTSSYKYLIYISGSTTNDVISLLIRTASGVTASNYTTSDGSTFNGVWHHLVGVYKRSDSLQRLKLYLDGFLVSTEIGYNEPILSGGTNPLVIGRWGSASGYFNGKIDQTAIWNRAITPAEVISLYNSGAGLAYTNWGGGTPVSGGTASPAETTVVSGVIPGAITCTAATGGTGTYSYQWQGSTNSGGSWTTISGATSTSYNAPALTQTTWYRRKVTSGTETAYSTVSKITVSAVLAGGIASPAETTVVSGVSPGAITCTAAPGGTGTYSYQWESSINSGGSWTTISGATTHSYTAPILTQTTWYRRKVTDGASPAAYSTESKITVTAGGGGEAGAPIDVNYLVGTADATLSNEIVVGTTPGGILGGSWANPTLDNNSIQFSHISAYGGTPSNGYVLGYNSTYGLVWSPAITGTGASGQMSFFTNTNSISSETEFSYNTTTNTLDVDNIIVNADTYNSGWNGSNKVPTQNDVYDKIESMSVQSGTDLWNDHTGYISYTGGNVAIGNSISQRDLKVFGKIYSNEVLVQTSFVVPDYVFEKNYKLMSLEEVESYIGKNNHLPEIPSAVEVEKNGIDLGEMNMLLLKKVEELTLYILQQEKRIKELEEKVLEK